MEPLRPRPGRRHGRGDLDLRDDVPQRPDGGRPLQLRERDVGGWGGDLVVPYRNGSGGYGYVWEIRWDTEEDASEFAQAYRAALTEEHDASQPRSNVYVVPADDQFNDAFRVVRSGKTVRIVNGPTVSDLDEIHQPAES